MLKVAVCHSFCLFFLLYIIHTIIQSHSYNMYIRRGLSPSPHRLTAQWDRPPCGAEPRIELGPAFQQADALPTDPRRTQKQIMIRPFFFFFSLLHRLTEVIAWLLKSLKISVSLRDRPLLLQYNPHITLWKERGDPAFLFCSA